MSVGIFLNNIFFFQLSYLKHAHSNVNISISGSAYPVQKRGYEAVPIGRSVGSVLSIGILNGHQLGMVSVTYECTHVG